MANQKHIFEVGLTTFGEPAMRDKTERILRFLEEAIELSRSAGLSYAEVVRMADFEYDRKLEVDITKEFGGAGVTLYAAAEAFGFDLDALIQKEITRVEANQEAIREKSKAKPDWVHSTRGIG